MTKSINLQIGIGRQEKCVSLVEDLTKTNESFTKRSLRLVTYYLPKEKELWPSKMQQVVKKFVDRMVKDLSFGNALIACCLQYKKFALIQSFIDLRMSKKPIFLCACRQESEEGISLSLNASRDFLMIAAQAGSLIALRILFDKRVAYNPTELLCAAARGGSVSALQFLIEKKKIPILDDQVIGTALIENKYEAALYLLSKVEKIENPKSFLELTCAGQESPFQFEVAEHLLDYFIQNKLPIDFSDFQDNTPLHHACKNGNLDLSDLLFKTYLKEGCSVVLENKDYLTPMAFAARWGQTRFLEGFYNANDCRTNPLEIPYLMGEKINADNSADLALIKVKYGALPAHVASLQRV